MFMTPASLLYRLRQPEEVTAWARFVDLYTPLLFHWAKKLGQQESDCADLVQDVFLILWRKLPEFEYDSGKSFHAWLKTIFLNRYRSHLRKHAAAHVNSPGLSGADFTVADFSDQLADEDDTRYLIQQAFRLNSVRVFDAPAASLPRVRAGGTISRDCCKTVGNQFRNRLRYQVKNSQPIATGTTANP